MSQPLRATPPSMTAACDERRSGGESIVDIGRAVIEQEAAALLALSRSLDGQAFQKAVSLLYACRGNVIVSGMGKAGLIGQKIAATLASTGTPSHFLHPAEAIHGDLGRIQSADVAVLLSHSGETEEIVKLFPALHAAKVPLLAITGKQTSQLARAAAITLWLGELQEAGELGLAPTTSTTAMLAMGDALALCVSQRRGFTPQDFARFHPGGALGRKLSRVDDVMRPSEECRIASQAQTVRQIFVTQGQPGRRSGAILVIDGNAKLVGIFTDSDLARLLENQQDSQLDQPISTVMTAAPISILSGTLLPEAIRELQARKISELPVVDQTGQPVGMIDITDVVAFMPEDTTQASRHDVDDEPRIFSLPNRNDVNP